MSSNGKYLPPDNKNDIWKHTSKWRPRQLEELKISVEDGNVVDPPQLSSIDMGPDVDRILLPGINVLSTDVKISQSQRPFFNRLNQLRYFPDEPPVDSVAYDLLTYSGFESEILHFRPRPHLELSWNDKEISSEADFGVYSGNFTDFLNAKYFVVVENKAEKRNVYQGGECQLCGEMLLAATTRFTNIKRDHTVYGMILRGLSVRFYKATFSKDYLSNLEKETILKKSITIQRFPSETTQALFLSDTDDREHIIRILCSIRKNVEELVSR
ncbi:hypothetical protein K7432_018499 [Basidiobolus ranarum]|uniref:Uncharacterized protein n=1 Tax=Basidiobolus ranarum TaxID=34480 RepID=A0ABR2WC46_9FUNG